MESVPKKIKPLLQQLKIVGVVGGYTTIGSKGALFTCWDKKGNPICVFEKQSKKDWTIFAVKNPDGRKYE